MVAPVITSQRARGVPITRGISAAWMTDGMPTLTSGIANCAWSDAMRKSQQIANSSPPPRHQPGMRAITGCGKLRTASQRSRRLVMKRSPLGLVQRRHLLDVGAADKGLFGIAAQHQRADAFLPAEFLDRRAQARRSPAS